MRGYIVVDFVCLFLVKENTSTDWNGDDAFRWNVRKDTKE